MESVGEESNAFSGMYSNEESDFMAQLLCNFSLPNESHSTLWLGHGPALNLQRAGDEGLMCNSDKIFSNLSYVMQGINSGCSILFPSSSLRSYYLNDSNHLFMPNSSSLAMDQVGMEKSTNAENHPFGSDLVEVNEFLNKDTDSCSMEEDCGANLPEEAVSEVKNLQLEKETEALLPESSTEHKNHLGISKKRSRSFGDGQQRKKTARSRKTQKVGSTGSMEEANNSVLGQQSSGSYCSGDDSNGSQGFIGGAISCLKSKQAAALNTNAKARATRGSATDPQSLYAKKRRERINERLRILQSLVPNGTKVDISTMLEEAVNYVKFLQLQIKLLSSDDLWMYAPIAYNGMDIGLDLKATPRK